MVPVKVKQRAGFPVCKCAVQASIRPGASTTHGINPVLGLRCRGHQKDVGFVFKLSVLKIIVNSQEVAQ